MKQSIIPYLMVENSKEMANYYEEVFGAEIVKIQTADTLPGNEDDESLKNFVIHMILKINDGIIMLEDTSEKVVVGNNVHIVLDYKKLSEMKEIYDKLSKDGEVVNQIQPVFWGAIYAIVKDKYGIHWQLNCPN